jgi:protein-S-isoprenylcysteine O-methyltransferase Ste14
MLGMSTPTRLSLSALGYVGFVVVQVWAVAFVAGQWLPRTVDGPHRLATGWAVPVDLALLLLFAVQHSVMARRRVKERLRRWVPASLERTTYVLATNVCLALLFVLWQPFGATLWHVGGAAAVLLWAFCAAGWALALASTFVVDHLELFGLRQAGWGRAVDAPSSLEVGSLFAFVRHPLMSGLLLAFWATPQMSGSHLLFAAAATGYIAVGVWFEERDLRRRFGAAYEEYAARVPALVPGLGPRRPASLHQDG